jgi:nucleoid-associated protein YgaU
MQTITVNGGNLFQIAAQYLGDATQWIRIAMQNGLSDPFLAVNPDQPVTLVIPDVDPNATGGVPPQ